MEEVWTGQRVQQQKSRTGEGAALRGMRDALISGMRTIMHKSQDPAGAAATGCEQA
jgi:hypothetical protein